MPPRPLTVLLALLLAAPAARAAEPYEHSEHCGACHLGTYYSWATTYHALAALNPIFREAYDRAGREAGPEERALCLTCHSPGAAATGDLALTTELSREGVGCDFCHTVTAVDLTQSRGRFRNRPGPVKTGPGRAKAPHPTERNPFSDRSEFCAGCHEWTTAAGLDLLTTYREWRTSDYAKEGISCRDCHMPEVPEDTVLVDGRPRSRPSRLHFRMGGHSQEQLLSAAQLQLESQPRPDRIEVRVEVANTRAGHALPTGIPNRRLRLRVYAYDRSGTVLGTQEREYARVVADAGGNVLQDVGDQFLRGAREVSDNRIRPREQRRETFSFPRLPGQNFMLIEAVLEYEILTPYLTPRLLRYDLLRRRLPVDLTEPPPAGPRPAPAAWLLAAAVAAAALLWYLRRRRRSSSLTR